MQQKLEELCQIETVLLLETVNVANLSQEHQVCSRVLQECSFDTMFITPWIMKQSNFEKYFTGCSRKIVWSCEENTCRGWQGKNVSGRICKTEKSLGNRDGTCQSPVT